MLSRHFLRSKVLQMAYANRTAPVDIVEIERNFRYYILRFNHLGTIQVSSMLQFVDVAAEMMEDAMHKFLPTEADLNPNRRLLNNVAIQRLRDNFDIRRQMDEAKVNWGGVEYDEIFRQAYAVLVRLPVYQKYVESKPTFENDHEFMLDLFKFLINHEPIREKLYAESLFWEDDYDQIAQYCYKMLKAMDESFDEATPFYQVCDMRDPSDEEAFDFARLLLLNTVRHSLEVESLIRKHLQGWEFERVAEIDILLLNMAVAELTECPSIPEKVTIDEYIELSKDFSSERSKLFINGILGKLMLELRSEGRINKIGRGKGEEPDASAEDDPKETVSERKEEVVPVVRVRKSRPRIKKQMIVALLVSACAFLSCSHAENTDIGVDLIKNPASAAGYDESEAMPVLTFDSDMHDFGRLSEGESISYSFHFRNTGNADLVISSCSASCGCTVADYPRKRIAPGEEGYVTITFNSQGKVGQQYQEVTVLSNAQPSQKRLKIMAQVAH